MTYQPGNVPGSVDPVLARYLREELTRISDAIVYGSGAGMLFQSEPTLNPDATTAYQKVETWDGSLPLQEERAIVADLPNNQLLLTRPGFYFLAWYLSADIASQREYDVTLHVNGEPTQSTVTQREGDRIVGFSAQATNRLDSQAVPATLDLRYRANGSGQFEVERGGISVAYLGD